jgi:arylsulfatase A-like enzyme
MMRPASFPWSVRQSAARCLVLATFSIVLATACGKDKEPQASAQTIPPASIPGKKGLEGKQVPTAESRGPEHALYSLIDNRLSAHAQRGGGPVVIGGSAGFVKYLRFRKSDMGWNIRAQREGKKVAIMGGKTGRLDVPLTAQQAAGKPALRMRVHNDSARALSIRINGQQKNEIGHRVEAGWSTISVDVPEGLLKAGENEILLFTGAGQPMALEWLQVGGQAGDDTPAIYDPGKKSLVLPRDGGLVYYVTVPDKGRVTGDLNDATCKVAVRATPDGDGEITGELAGNGSAVDLAGLAGRPVRLELTGKDCEVAHLSGAALVVPGPGPTMVKRQAAPPKYVILWIMDSLRADRVRPFNPKARPETPTFERLGKEGAVFTQAYVQGNESRVSHASLWSALYPVKHNMIAPKAKLDSKWTTIDELMRDAGMFTSGVSANGYVDSRWGFGTAWNTYHNHIHEKSGLTGADVMGRAIKTIEGKTDPWFLYIGTIDTHVSWRPKAPWISKYHPASYDGRFAKRFSGEDAGKGDKLNMTQAEIEWVRALYDSNVSYQDDLLRQLLDKLKEWGIADQTMIVITSDHGDEQWEDGRVGHGASLRETLVHVPLLIHYPAMVPARMITEGVDVLDVMPTVADLLGAKMDEEWQGESLLPLAHGVGAGYPRMSLASQYEGAHVGRIGAWKLRAPGSASPNLYNVSRDPDERTDLTGKNPVAYRFMADPLWLKRAYNADWKKRFWGNAANVTGAFPEHFGE